MDGELIRRDAVRTALELLKVPVFVLDNIPAEDAAPVRHGRWVIEPPGIFRRCDQCGARSLLSIWKGSRLPAWCDCCGARMDGDARSV